MTANGMTAQVSLMANTVSLLVSAYINSTQIAIDAASVTIKGKTSEYPRLDPPNI